jgi:Ser/Thr protein kinase RdoA (MazF antagonist)
VFLHGDVHADNMLFHDDQVHLIDFDQASLGAPAEDLCGMLASLAVLRLTGDTPAAGLGTAMLEGYSTIRSLPSPADLRWYTAAALLVERAIRGVNRVYRPTLAALPELLNTAERILAGTVDLDG